MKQNIKNTVLEGCKVITIGLAMTAVAVAVRTLIWMPQIF